MGRAAILNVLWIGAFAVLLGILAYVVGVEDVAAALAAADERYLLLAFVSYAVFFLVRGLRWRLLLRDLTPQLGAGTAAGLTAGGWLISTFVPFKAGDLSRIAYVARKERASLAAVGGTVVLERVLDVMGLAVLASLGLLTLASALPDVPSLLGEALALAWILPVCGLAVLFLVARRVDPQDPRFLPRTLGRFVRGVESLRATPRRIPLLLALSLLAVLFQALVFAALFLALRPNASFLMAAAVSPLFLLSFALPLTPGHVGTYEAAFVLVYGLLGGTPSELAPLAVACHLLGIGLVVLLGTLGLASLRFAPLATPSQIPLEEPTP